MICFVYRFFVQFRIVHFVCHFVIVIGGLFSFIRIHRQWHGPMIHNLKYSIYIMTDTVQFVKFMNVGYHFRYLFNFNFSECVFWRSCCMTERSRTCCFLSNLSTDRHITMCVPYTFMENIQMDFSFYFSIHQITGAIRPVGE